MVRSSLSRCYSNCSKSVWSWRRCIPSALLVSSALLGSFHTFVSLRASGFLRTGFPALFLHDTWLCSTHTLVPPHFDSTTTWLHNTLGPPNFGSSELRLPPPHVVSGSHFSSTHTHPHHPSLFLFPGTLFSWCFSWKDVPHTVPWLL